MRRGQAALEYVITYGWGFIVLILAIGALAYFGFLNPTKYIPSRCEFGSQLECVDFKLDAATAGMGGNNGKVSLRFRNNFGDTINITTIQTTTGTGTFAGPVRIVKGNTSVVIVYTISSTDVPYLTAGDRLTVPLIITFRRDQANAPLHNITGEVFATVQ